VISGVAVRVQPTAKGEFYKRRVRDHQSPIISHLCEHSPVRWD